MSQVLELRDAAFSDQHGGRLTGDAASLLDGNLGTAIAPKPIGTRREIIMGQTYRTQPGLPLEV